MTQSKDKSNLAASPCNNSCQSGNRTEHVIQSGGISDSTADKVSPCSRKDICCRKPFSHVRQRRGERLGNAEDVKGKRRPQNPRKRRSRMFIAKYLPLIVVAVLITLGVEALIALAAQSALFTFQIDKSGLQTLLFFDGLLWIGIGVLSGRSSGASQEVGYGTIPPATQDYMVKQIIREKAQHRETTQHSHLIMIATGGLFLLLSLIVFVV